MSFLKGSRTILFNVAAAVPMAADLAVQVLQYPGVSDIVPVSCYPYYALTVAALNVILRVKTTGPVKLPGKLGKVQDAVVLAKELDRAVRSTQTKRP